MPRLTKDSAGPERPVLTEMDARRVLEAHFGDTLGTARRAKDGIYSVEIGGMLPVADVGRRATLTATSASSFEAALHDLAVLRSDLLEVPLEDPTGLFESLRRHRLDRDGLFEVRDAPLTSDDCFRLDELKREMPRLRKLLRPVLGWSSAGPAGFNIEVYAQFMLHRIFALVDGSVGAWNGRNSIASAILARAVLETVAVWVKVTRDAERHIREGEYDVYDNLIARIFFGKKTQSDKVSATTAATALSPIQVLTAVETLEKEYPGVRAVYDQLSEIAHPNGESFFAISDWQEVDSVSLDSKGAGGDLLGRILSALRIDIAREYLIRWEKDLAPRMGRHWREVHHLPPVDDGTEST
jgi:hypothetical protein